MNAVFIWWHKWSNKIRQKNLWQLIKSQSTSVKNRLQRPISQHKNKTSQLLLRNILCACIVTIRATKCFDICGAWMINIVSSCNFYMIHDKCMIFLFNIERRNKYDLLKLVWSLCGACHDIIFLSFDILWTLTKFCYTHTWTTC